MKQGQAEKSKSRKDIARSTKPIICYAVENLPPKSGSESLYKELRTAVKDGKATLVTKLEIPPCDARSWKVPAGCLFRIICTHGPQVCMYVCIIVCNPMHECIYVSYRLEEMSMSMLPIRKYSNFL